MCKLEITRVQRQECKKKGAELFLSLYNKPRNSSLLYLSCRKSNVKYWPIVSA